jgi:EAL domain-containing protein (putative c-di-GMP-specific phosphodiesterase class I)
MACNGDIMCCCSGISRKDILPLVSRVRHLFSEDPISVFETEKYNFFEFFQLETHFRDWHETLAKIANNEIEGSSLNEVEKWITFPEKKPFTPKVLVELEGKLKGINLSRFIRSQNICSFSKDGRPLSTYREIYVSISDLQSALMQDVNLLSNSLHFQYLTKHLDRHVLSYLSEPGYESTRGSLSLNLNVASIFSAEFARLEERLRSENSQSVMVEFQKMDVFSDIGAFFFSRDTLQDKGFKVCLDSMTPMVMPYINWRDLGLDCVKLYWSSDLKSSPNKSTSKQEHSTVIKVLQGLSKKEIAQKVILAHCNDEEVLRWGQELGIQQFQGWYIDQLLMPGFRNKLSVYR